MGESSEKMAGYMYISVALSFPLELLIQWSSIQRKLGLEAENKVLPLWRSWQEAHT